MNQRLTNDVTVEAEMRIKSDLGARLADRYCAVLIGNIVNARLTLRDRENCGVGGSIDVQ